MSGYLSDAIVAAATAALREWQGRATYETVARNILDAVDSLIEKAVREQAAQEIEATAAQEKKWAGEAAAARGGIHSTHDTARFMGLAAAARIARGES